MMIMMTIRTRAYAFCINMFFLRIAHFRNGNRHPKRLREHGTQQGLMCSTPAPVSKTPTHTLGT